MSGNTNLTNLSLPFDESHAFIIGIDDYRNGVEPLSTAVQDAKDIAKVLAMEIHGYTTHVLLDANKSDMLAMFETMKNHVEQKHRVIFYFAGHGIALDTDAAEPKGYLVPVDANGKERESLVPMDALGNTLASLAQKDSQTHVLFILDCCFSGAFKWASGSRSFTFDEKDILYAERVIRFAKHKACQVITSASHDQKAADVLNPQAFGIRDRGGIGESNNSPFAWALKQALLEGEADVVRNQKSDGIITATELSAYLRDTVEPLTRKTGVGQTPSFFPLKHHDSKGEFIFFNPKSPLNLPPAPDFNPYKGLKVFQYLPKDHQLFFGRKETVLNMAKALETTSLMVVSAPSATGKSSTVLAGLFPYLASLEEAYEEFHILRPGHQSSEEQTFDWKDLPNLDQEKRVVVLIDQFEEIFSESIGDTDPYYEALVNFYENHGSHEVSEVKLILTIRSDFEWQLKNSPFGEQFWNEKAVYNFLFRLPPMGLEELRAAMIKPAEKIAYTFETEEMVNLILKEIGYAPQALPVLSLTMQQLYEFRDTEERLFTMDAYRKKLGGVSGALTKHADRVMQQMIRPNKSTSKEIVQQRKDCLKKLFLRMVTLNDGGYSKRKVYINRQGAFTEFQNEKLLNELDYVDHDDTMVKEIINELIEHQLISGGRDGTGAFIEPVHDSLINQWETCLKWINDFGKENLSLQRTLWKAVLDLERFELRQQQGQQSNDIKGEVRKSNRKEDKDLTNTVSPYWDSNPNLLQIINQLIYPLDEEAFQNMISSLKELDEKQKVFLEKLNEEFKSKGTITDLHELMMSGISSQLIHYFLHHGMHWLNEAEVNFIHESWRRRVQRIEEIQRQRDDAIKAAIESAKMAHAFKQKLKERGRMDLEMIKRGIKPDLHYLLVGINTYFSPLPPLGACVQDVEKMEAAFSQEEGKLYEKVYKHTLTEEKATKKNIFQALAQIQAEASPTDYVIIFLVGHAIAREVNDQNGQQAYSKGYFLPYLNEEQSSKLDIKNDSIDDQCLSGDELCEMLMTFSSKVVLILDICYGGEFLQPLVEANHSKQVDTLAHNVFAISGTSYGQVSYEEKDKHGELGGIFSNALRHCFDSKEADLDGNGVVYLDELYRYANEYVQKSDHEQDVFAVIPPTMTNIPLIQLSNSFELPGLEIALSGHIEEEDVIMGIIRTFLDDVEEEKRNHFLAALQQVEIEKLIQSLEEGEIIELR